MSNLTSEQKQLADLARKAESLRAEMAALRAKAKATGNLEKAKRIVIEKSFFSATQAAQKVGMPVTSFKRFVDKFGLGPTATLDGLPCYSPEWIEAFKQNHDSIELGAQSFSMLGRKEGKAIMERSIKAVNRFGSGVNFKPETKKAISDTGIQPRRLVDRNGKVMIAVTNADGSNTYRDESGKVITTSSSSRSYTNERIEAFKEANLRRHEESRKRFEAEQEERRRIQVAKLKGLTPVASFSAGK